VSTLETVSDIAIAAKALAESSVVLVKSGRILAGKTGRGVKPLLDAIDEAGDVCGAALADRVVGVGVAKMALLFEIAAVHAGIISEPARNILVSAGISVSHDFLVPRILNRDRTGPCPVEAMSIGPIPPAELYSRLRGMFCADRGSSG